MEGKDLNLGMSSVSLSLSVSVALSVLLFLLTRDLVVSVGELVLVIIKVKDTQQGKNLKICCDEQTLNM